MDKAIRKFLAYLDKIAEEIKKEAFSVMLSNDFNKDVRLKEIDLRDREVTNFKKYFTSLKDYEENHGEIFADYKILCSYLDSSYLNSRDKYYIILYFIEKNIHSGILVSDTLLVDLKDLENKSVNERVAKFIRNLIVNNGLQEFMTRNVSELTEGELEIYNTIKMFAIDLTPYKDTTLLFKNHLVDKKNSLTEYDIDVVESTLIDVGVSEDCLSAFLNVLRKDMSKQVCVETPIVIQRQEVKRDPNLLTDKEYKAIKKEVRSVYDHYNRKLLREVTSYKEMLEIAKKMARVDYEEYDIENFFREVMKQLNIDYLNIIGEFVSNFDKYSYYLEEDTINEILEYMGEMFICDDETYKFWKSEVSRILRNEEHKFKNKYDYELALVRKSK